MNNDEIKSIIDVVKSCDDVVLGTNRLDGYPDLRTIMNALNADINNLDLHFITDRDSPKMKQLHHNAKCTLYYFNPNTRYAVRLFGEMNTVDDIAEKEKYWHDDYKQFGYTGADDPELALLQFKPHSYKFYVGDEMKTGLI